MNEFLNSLAIDMPVVPRPLTNLTQLEDEPLETTLVENEFVVVVFLHRTGECGTFRKGVRELAARFSEIRFVEVNARTHGKFCADNGIRSTPAVGVFVGGKLFNYRMFPSVVSFEEMLVGLRSKGENNGKGND